MAKLDARKRYTQMILNSLFLKLLKEKPVNKITVKELCELSPDQPGDILCPLQRLLCTAGEH